MIEVINSSDERRLTAKLQHIRSRSIGLDPGLMAHVANIIDDVRRRGDASLIDYALQFDGIAMQPSELRISEDALRRIAAGVHPSVLAALREAITNVRRFHEYELEKSCEF